MVTLSTVDPEMNKTHSILLININKKLTLEIQSASDKQSNADFQKNQLELSCTFSADKKSDNGSKQHTFV
jgi:hypothetical protein